MKFYLGILLLSWCLIVFLTNSVSSQSGSHDDSSIVQAQKDIIIVLDNSGSMKKNDPKFLTKEVVSNFVAGLDEDSRIAIFLFDETVNRILPLTKLSKAENRKKVLQSLSKVTYRGQFTDIPAAIERAIYELKQNGRGSVKGSIIFLTDGLIDTGDKIQDREKRNWLLNSLLSDAKEAKISIFGIAFTENADFQLIQQIARQTNGEYYRALTAEDIQPVFNKILQELSIIRYDKEEDILEAESTSDQSQSFLETNVVLIIILGIIIIGIITVVLIFRSKSNAQPVIIQESGDVQATGDSARRRGNNESVPKAKLIDLDKVTGKSTFAIDRPEISIGREKDNDLVIENEHVSGHHGIIRYRNKKFYLIDNGSANGTFHNGQRLEAEIPVPLSNNDEIAFDVINFRVVLPSSAKKTVLRTGSQEESGGGTVLRPKDEKESVEVSDEKKGDESEPKEQAHPKPVKKTPEEESEEKETVLKSEFCPNHPAWAATELCPECKKGYCKNCVVEVDGKKICKGCAEKAKASEGDDK